MTKRLCQDETAKHLDVLLARRFIPLDKKRSLRPIGVEVVLRRVIGKIVMKPLK